MFDAGLRTVLTQLFFLTKGHVYKYCSKYWGRQLGARANVASRPTGAASPLVRRHAASGRTKW